VARKTSVTSLRQICEINLTSLIDLSFLLLITFIITFPLIEQGIPVNLPREKTKDLTSPKAQTITVDQHGNIYLDNIAINLEQLGARMMQIGKADPEVTVMIRADERIKYGLLAHVLRILHDAGIVKMALVTQAEQKSQP